MTTNGDATAQQVMTPPCDPSVAADQPKNCDIARETMETQGQNEVHSPTLHRPSLVHSQ